MSLVLSSSFIYRCVHGNHVKVPHIMIPQISLLHPSNNSSHYDILQKRFFANKNIATIVKHKQPSEFRAAAYMKPNDEFIDDESDEFIDDESDEFIDDESSIEDDWSDHLDTYDTESPWEGAILYERDPSISHLEYCTTLERLGLGNCSTEVSKSQASLMGLRITKSVTDFPHGTPVIVSIDVTRKKQKLRLDGIVRTVLCLACFRCGSPTAQPVFSNFSLLLTEEPTEEPEGDIEIDYRPEDDASIDLEDCLYFPPQEEVIDISKNVRDIVHLEITFDALCTPLCKGLCFNCGINLNTDSCSCSEKNEKLKPYSPFSGLKDRLQL